MQQTKAQIQLQFNWVFVLIVGTVILVFFFSLIGGQSKNSEESVAINLAQRMKTILSATEQQPGTIKVNRRIPDLEISFVCDSRQDYYNFVVEGIDAIDTKYNLFFSPTRLEGNVIYTWAKEWSVPYHVANFLYVTNNNEHYVFYNGSILRDMTDLYEEFPENFSQRTWNTGESDKDMNVDGYTYVFFRQQLNNPSLDLEFANAGPGTKGKIIVIDPKVPSDPFSYGELHYIYLQRSEVATIDTTGDLTTLLVNPGVTSTSMYIGKASLYGAIFSETKTTYECNMDKALQRLQIITLLQYYRTQEIAPVVSANCAYLLDAPATGASHYLKQLNSTLNGNFNVETAKQLNEGFTQLDKINNQLASMGGCPALY